MAAIIVANAPAIPIRDVNVLAVVLPAFARFATIVRPVLAGVAAVLPPIFAGIAPVFAPILSLLMPPGFAFVVLRLALMVLRFAFVPPDISFLMTGALVPPRSFVPRA